MIILRCNVDGLLVVFIGLALESDRRHGEEILWRLIVPAFLFSIVHEALSSALRRDVAFLSVRPSFSLRIFCFGELPIFEFRNLSISNFERVNFEIVYHFVKHPELIAVP